MNRSLGNVGCCDVAIGLEGVGGGSAAINVGACGSVGRRENRVTLSCTLLYHEYHWPRR
jgi:hypothetical protein